MPSIVAVSSIVSVLLLCAIAAFAVGSLSPYQPPMAMTTSSPRFDLSGKWDFRFDPDGKGEEQGWFKPDVAGCWESIAVPGSYNIAFADKLTYQGKGWYRRTFEMPAAPNGARAVFHCLGAALRVKAWLNGQRAISGRADAQGFPDTLKGEALLKRGWNRLVVKVSLEPGMKELYVRLCDKDGGPIPGLKVSLEPFDTSKPEMIAAL